MLGFIVIDLKMTGSDEGTKTIGRGYPNPEHASTFFGWAHQVNRCSLYRTARRNSGQLERPTDIDRLPTTSEQTVNEGQGIQRSKN